MVAKTSLALARSNLSTTSVILQKAQVQKAAPDFKGQAVVNGQFKQISLKDYHGKWLVFFFYPLDFTFVCPTEIIAFSEAIDQFKAINCEVILFSVKLQKSRADCLEDVVI